MASCISVNPRKHCKSIVNRAIAGFSGHKTPEKYRPPEAIQRYMEKQIAALTVKEPHLQPGKKAREMGQIRPIARLPALARPVSHQAVSPP